MARGQDRRRTAGRARRFTDRAPCPHVAQLAARRMPAAPARLASTEPALSMCRGRGHLCAVRCRLEIDGAARSVRVFGACSDASEALSALTWGLDPAGRARGVSFVEWVWGLF